MLLSGFMICLAHKIPDRLGFARCEDDPSKDAIVPTRAKRYKRYPFVIKPIPIGKVLYFLGGDTEIVGKEIQRCAERRKTFLCRNNARVDFATFRERLKVVG